MKKNNKNQKREKEWEKIQLVTLILKNQNLYNTHKFINKKKSFKIYKKFKSLND